MNNFWKRMSVLLLLSVLLITSGCLSFDAGAAAAQENLSGEQRTSAAPNPREDVAFLKEEMEKFGDRVFLLMQNKSAEEATEIFFEELELFYDIVGEPFKWRYEDFYEFVAEWEKCGIHWPGSEYYVRGLPQEDELTEDEAIELARKTVLFFSEIPAAELDLCWPRASYHKPKGGQYSWHVDFLVETPESDFPYYVRFMLEIDPKTSIIYSYFDSRSNDI